MRVLGTMANNAGALGASVGLHLFCAALVAHHFVSPRTTPDPPQLLLDSVELTLAEVESETSVEATASDASSPARAVAMPDSAPLLAVPDSAIALPESLPPPEPIPLPERTLQTSPEPPMPELESSRNLPEIALPPVQAVRSDNARQATGETARLKKPRLVTDLSRLRKYYPAEARARGWEGTVELQITVNAEGRLEAVSIYRSSGHRVLDNAAMQMMKSARFAGGPGTLIQPIDYSLK